MSNTIENFQYFCHKLIERYDSLGLKYMYQHDFGRLGVMKMLFFAVISSNQNGTNQLIDNNIFDNFWALPNGPVESDCYNFINGVENFEATLKAKGFLVKESFPIIDQAILDIPTLLFRKDSFDLVEISHRYASWRDAYQTAIRSGKKAYKMDNASILKENILLAVL